MRKGEGVTEHAACMHLHGLGVCIYLRQLTFNKHKRHIFKRDKTNTHRNLKHKRHTESATKHQDMLGQLLKKGRVLKRPKNEINITGKKA